MQAFSSFFADDRVKNLCISIIFLYTTGWFVTLIAVFKFVNIRRIVS